MISNFLLTRLFKPNTVVISQHAALHITAWKQQHLWRKHDRFCLPLREWDRGTEHETTQCPIMDLAISILKSSSHDKRVRKCTI